MEKKLQDICNYLIEKTKAPLEDGKTDFGSTMTNLRLQKMLYFVYGIYYANSKKELFTPNFEA
jgi:uncharacterized phage-associated protein